MKKQPALILGLGVFAAIFIFLTAFLPKTDNSSKNHPGILNSDDQLKIEAFEILHSKCNVCHRKQNPIMVFNRKNMEKRAPKIYKMVFIDRRMPKGNKIRLSKEEYNKLEKWLLTQNIN